MDFSMGLVVERGGGGREKGRREVEGKGGGRHGVMADERGMVVGAVEGMEDFCGGGMGVLLVVSVNEGDDGCRCWVVYSWSRWMEAGMTV